VECGCRWICANPMYLETSIALEPMTCHADRKAPPGALPGMTPLYQKPPPQSMITWGQRRAAADQMVVVLVHLLKAGCAVQCTQIPADGANCVDICYP